MDTPLAGIPCGCFLPWRISPLGPGLAHACRMAWPGRAQIGTRSSAFRLVFCATRPSEQEPLRPLCDPPLARGASVRAGPYGLPLFLAILRMGIHTRPRLPFSGWGLLGHYDEIFVVAQLDPRRLRSVRSLALRALLVRRRVGPRPRNPTPADRPAEPC